MVIVAILLILVFMCLPLKFKIILTILNMIIPDRIPVLDELITICGTLGHILRALKVAEFSEEHPIIFKFLVLITIAAVIYAVVTFINSI